MWQLENMEKSITFIQNMPKVELHLHIEGTLEPEMMMQLSKQNGVEIPYLTIEEIRKAYQFSDLQSFLDIYYAGAKVLLHEDDFFDLTFAYLQKMHQENCRHVEIFFDPQTHTSRGVPIKIVINGISNALKKGKEEFGISSHLILSFLRHLSEEDAIKTLNEALPYKDKITAVGLDSSEKGNPPSKFISVFELARKEGLLTLAHAGEEGPAGYIWQAIQELHISRIDHGVHCSEDANLIDYLEKTRLPLTVCPLSNVKLRVFDTVEQHNIKELLDQGLCVTVNSDDPAYFGGYLTENYIAIAKGLHLKPQDILKLASNSIEASFLSQEEKGDLQAELEECYNSVISRDSY